MRQPATPQKVSEYSEGVGRLLDLERACARARAEGHMPDDALVSFRDRGGFPVVVLRWIDQPCEFADAGCARRADWLGQNGGAFCSNHGEDNYPDFTSDDAVACEQPLSLAGGWAVCTETAVIKIAPDRTDGARGEAVMLNLCFVHATRASSTLTAAAVE